MWGAYFFFKFSLKYCGVCTEKLHKIKLKSKLELSPQHFHSRALVWLHLDFDKTFEHCVLKTFIESLPTERKVQEVSKCPSLPTFNSQIYFLIVSTFAIYFLKLTFFHNIQFSRKMRFFCALILTSTIQFPLSCQSLLKKKVHKVWLRLKNLRI